jgi:hypothetical protein
MNMSPPQSQIQEPIEPPNPIARAVAHLADASRALNDAARCLQGAAPERSPSRAAGRRDLSPDARITLKQLGAVRGAARRAGLSEQAVRELVAEVSAEASDVTELSKAEASALLDKLNTQSGFGR